MSPSLDYLALFWQAQQQDQPKQQEWGPQSPTDRSYGDEEGLFVAEVADGEEHYSWPDGSEYFGEWRDGQPNGRGIYVSQSGGPKQPTDRATYMSL